MIVRLEIIENHHKVISAENQTPSACIQRFFWNQDYPYPPKYYAHTFLVELICFLES